MTSPSEVLYLVNNYDIMKDFITYKQVWTYVLKIAIVLRPEQFITYKLIIIYPILTYLNDGFIFFCYHHNKY